MLCLPFQYLSGSNSLSLLQAEMWGLSLPLLSAHRSSPGQTRSSGRGSFLPQCWGPLGFLFTHFPIPACCSPPAHQVGAKSGPTDPWCPQGLRAPQGQPGAVSPFPQGTHRAESQPGWAMGTGPWGAGDTQLRPT